MNQKGSFHLIAAGVLFLGVVGAWYLYRSFQSWYLQQDSSELREDLRKSVVIVAPKLGAEASRMLDGAKAKISETVQKIIHN